MKKLFTFFFALMLVLGIRAVVSATTIDAFQPSGNEYELGFNGVGNLNLNNISMSVIFDTEGVTFPIGIIPGDSYELMAVNSNRVLASGSFDLNQIVPFTDDAILSLSSLQLHTTDLNNGTLYIKLYDETAGWWSNFYVSLDASEEGWCGEYYSTLTGTPIPEPGTLLLVGFGLLGLGSYKLRKKVAA
jgi:hypothetical protein